MGATKHIMMAAKKMYSRLGLAWVVLSALVLFSGDVLAHGERAQLPSMRMRTVHWFDTQVTPLKAKVGDTVTLTGKFIPSVYWPETLPSIAATAYLNVGVPGPTFLRVHSEVNGVPMMRSTAFPLGKVYEYKVVLRARIPGRYHVHPLINVLNAGSLIGKGTWIEIDKADTDAPFVNNATLLTGETVDLETFGLRSVIGWHLVWIAMGVAWLLFWLIRKELFIPRFMRIRALGAGRANELLTKKDFVVSAIFFTLTLTIILTGYLWAERKYPLTIPLQTGKVGVQGLDVPTGNLKIYVDSASYKLEGRSLTMHVKMTNNGERPLRIDEFITANIRFINPKVAEGKIVEGEEMVARNGLTVSVDTINPGETKDAVIVASDTLWEQYRMTGLIHDPDSRFAGLLFYNDDQGKRYYQEVGGSVLPSYF
ncbi:MAG: bacterial ammonia monooxygenase, subunit AmoB [Porticoccaceae bacterium]